MRPNTSFIATNIPRQLTNYTQSRIDYALAAFAGRFDSVKVSLAERRNESGSVTCEIKVRLVPSGIWIIQECRDANPYAAIENAAEGIARSLGRQLARLEALQPLTSAARWGAEVRHPDANDLQPSIEKCSRPSVHLSEVV